MTKPSKRNDKVPKIANSGEAIPLSKIELIGVAVEPALPGQTVKIATRLMMTSDDPWFHTIAESLTGAIEHSATVDQKAVDLKRAATVLLVVKPDGTARLWVDAAAMTLNILAKRSIKAGSAIFEDHIGDVVGMDFPLAGITEADRIICISRVGWRFALFFDLDRARPLDLSAMRRDLGTLFRVLRYRNVYDAIANPAVFDRLVTTGWFPFVEILGSEFRELVQACQAGWPFDGIEAKLLANFPAARLRHMFDRWMGRPHFADKKSILKAAMSAFKRRDAISAIKITLTEIEGVLRQAHRARSGESASLRKLLEFAVRSAEEKAGSADTLLFPQEFGQYLAKYAFANFDPEAATGSAGSRHAVGHGAAEADTYTQIRALQALLTLDQLAFYT